MTTRVFPTTLHGCLGIRVLGTVAAMAAGLSHASAQSPLSLWIDPTTTTLYQNTPGQIVRVLIQNTGAPFPVIGGTFYFQIDNGDSTSGTAPSITGVSITDIPGNPFISPTANPISANVDPLGTSADAELWSVSFSSLPPTPVTPVNLTGGSILSPAQYTFAEVTVDTTGLFTVGQSWDFKIFNTVSGDPFFDIEDPSDPTNLLTEYPSATNGTIQIGAVPIPEATLPAGGVGVLGVALMSTLWRRRVSIAGSRPG